MSDLFWKSSALVLYCGVLLVIGYFASKKMRNIRDYYAGGKNLGFINVAFSSRATGESAWLLLGLTGTGFAFGLQGMWIVLGELLGVAGAWLLMARRFKRLTDHYDNITIPDYLESRLRDNSHWLRLIAAGTLIIFVPIYAGSQVFATGKAFNSFLDMNHFVGATIGFLVVLLYITKGGFIAVVWSDVFQGLLMVCGLVLLPIVGVMEAGGLTEILGTLKAVYPAHLSLTFDQGWSALTIAKVVGFAAIGIGFLGSPQVFVRFISLKSDNEIAKGASVALIWTVLADAGAVLLGVVGRALFTDVQVSGNPENILPLMSQSLLLPFFAGIYIAMVLSAIMSTVDSLLVVASSASVRDYWQKIKHPELSDEQLIKLSQIVTFVLAILAFLIGIGILLYDTENGVFWIIIFGWSGIAATFCPVMILSLFWQKLTALGAQFGMMAGFLSTIGFKFVVPPLLLMLGWEKSALYLEELDVLLPAFIMSGLVTYFVSIFDHKGQERIANVNQDFELMKK